MQEFKPLEEQPQSQPVRVPAHDAPSKFWQSIEPFCQAIQPDTIKMLEQLYQVQQDNDEYMKASEIK